MGGPKDDKRNTKSSSEDSSEDSDSSTSSSDSSTSSSTSSSSSNSSNSPKRKTSKLSSSEDALKAKLQAPPIQQLPQKESTVIPPAVSKLSSKAADSQSSNKALSKVREFDKDQMRSRDLKGHASPPKGPKRIDSRTTSPPNKSKLKRRADSHSPPSPLKKKHTELSTKPERKKKSASPKEVINTRKQATHQHSRSPSPNADIRKRRLDSSEQIEKKQEHRLSDIRRHSGRRSPIVVRKKTSLSPSPKLKRSSPIRKRKSHSRSPRTSRRRSRSKSPSSHGRRSLSRSSRRNRRSRSRSPRKNRRSRSRSIRRSKRSRSRSPRRNRKSRSRSKQAVRHSSRSKSPIPRVTSNKRRSRSKTPPRPKRYDDSPSSRFRKKRYEPRRSKSRSPKTRRSRSRSVKGRSSSHSKEAKRSNNNVKTSVGSPLGVLKEGRKSPTNSKSKLDTRVLVGSTPATSLQHGEISGILAHNRHHSSSETVYSNDKDFCNIDQEKDGKKRGLSSSSTTVLPVVSSDCRKRNYSRSPCGRNGKAFKEYSSSLKHRSRSRTPLGKRKVSVERKTKDNGIRMKDRIINKDDERDGKNRHHHSLSNLHKDKHLSNQMKGRDLSQGRKEESVSLPVSSKMDDKKIAIIKPKRKRTRSSSSSGDDSDGNKSSSSSSDETDTSSSSSSSSGSSNEGSRKKRHRKKKHTKKRKTSSRSKGKKKHSKHSKKKRSHKKKRKLSTKDSKRKKSKRHPSPSSSSTASSESSDSEPSPRRSERKEKEAKGSAMASSMTSRKKADSSGIRKDTRDLRLEIQAKQENKPTERIFGKTDKSNGEQPSSSTVSGSSKTEFEAHVDQSNKSSWKKEPERILKSNVDKRERLKPMTFDDYIKQQQTVRRVEDPETGRTRLIRGTGEILEEIVSKARHKEINRTATKSDGDYFQKIISNSARSNK